MNCTCSIQSDGPKSLNCSLGIPAPGIKEMFAAMTPSQKIILYLEIFICAWLMLLLLYDFFYFKRRLAHSPRLQCVLFIQSTFVFYATTSLLAVASPRSSTLTDLVFTVYFSFTLKEILWLMVEYLGGDVCVALNMNDVPVALAVTPLCCLFGRCCPTILVSKNYLYWVKFMVYQSAIIHTIFDFVSAFLWTNGLYNEGDHDPKKLSFYLSLFEKISILVAIYSLTSLFSTARAHLEPYHIAGKFWCIQMTMLISGFQETVFGLLVLPGIIKGNSILSASVQATVFHHYVVVPEMVILYVISRYFHTRDEGNIDENAFSRRNTAISFDEELYNERRPLI